MMATRAIAEKCFRNRLGVLSGLCFNHAENTHRFEWTSAPEVCPLAAEAAEKRDGLCMPFGTNKVVPCRKTPVSRILFRPVLLASGKLHPPVLRPLDDAVRERGAKPGQCRSLRS